MERVFRDADQRVFGRVDRLLMDAIVPATGREVGPGSR